MKTKSICPHCGRPLKKSRNKEYAFECQNCDEDFYEIEVVKNEQLKTV
jgi:ribosomal protein L37AE/L43A